MSSCSYFTLYDAEMGTETEWADRLREQFENEVDDETRRQIRIRGEAWEAARSELLDRPWFDEESLDDHVIEKLIEADRTRTALGLPQRCPHDAVADEDYCLFHLSPEQRREHEISPEEVCAQFYDEICGENATKCFAGSDLEALTLSYELISSENNRPIQLQFCEIANLGLAEAEVRETLQFDYGTIGEIDCESTEFGRDVSFEKTEIESGRVSFQDAAFRQDVSFDGADVVTSQICFDRCDFEGETRFSDIDVDLELSGRNRSDDPISFRGAAFEGPFEMDGADFSPDSTAGTTTGTEITVKFNHCTFAGEVSIERCRIGAIEKQENSLEAQLYGEESDEYIWDVQLRHATLESGISARGTNLDGHFTIHNANFGGSACTFSRMTLNGGLTVTNSTFARTDVDFSRCEVHGEDIKSRTKVFDVSNTAFGSGRSDFTSVYIDGDANFEQTEFDGKNVSFNELEATGSLNFRGVVCTNDGGTIDFSNVEVGRRVHFDQAQLSGNEIDFSDAKMGHSLVSPTSGGAGTRTISFEGSTWNGGEIKFRSAELTGGVTFDQATFSGDKLGLEDAVVVGDFTFVNCKVSVTKVDFTDLEVTDAAAFDVANSRFASNDAEFDAMELQADRVRFRGAVFESRVTFDHSAFVVATDSNDPSTSNEAPRIDFTRVNGEAATLEFRNVTTNGPPLDFTEATIMDGEFITGRHDTTYVLKEATVGDIEIQAGGEDETTSDVRLFEHFVFRNTTFDGFDFSREGVKEQLKRSGWQIHTTSPDEGSTNDVGVWAKLARFFGKYGRLVREGPDPDFDPNELEVTYMKAKLGADQNGDPDAVSHFFQKELGYRRQSYGYQFWQQAGEAEATSDVIRRRIRNGWNWLANTTLWLTVGYGERPSNVFITSLVTILVFGFIYRGIGALDAGSSLVDYMTYSLQGFIQLVVGITPANDVIVRFWTSVEGFLGAFIIALFVITLTRSIDR